MPFIRSNPPPLSLDKKYLKQLSPTTRPMDLSSVNKGPAYSLAGNWSYDSTIDLFSLNLPDIDPMSFHFEDLFMDPFVPSTPINGSTMPATGGKLSLSSDLDSDDQSWRNISQQLDLKTEQTEHEAPSNNPSTSTNTTNTSCPTSASTTTSRKARSLSQDSSHSTSTSPPRTQTQTQDPQTRNEAKRAAHNAIERRYRTNMNIKLLALEQAIAPSGSEVHKSSSRGAAGSLKKSEILTNALAYIKRVQGENIALKEEVALLTGERGVLPGAGAGWRG